MKQIITNIYWDRIYLHVQLSGEMVPHAEFVLSSYNNKKSYPLTLTNNNEIIINMTNIHHKMMIQNGNWYFKYLIDNQYYIIPMTLEVGQKLASLDKVFRYGGNNYAYIITFAPKRKNDLYFCMSVTFMMQNRNPRKRHILNEGGNNRVKLKKECVYMIEKIQNLIFKAVSALTHKNKKRILLMSESRTPISGNLLALDNRLKERHLDQELKISYYFKNTRNLSQLKMMLEWFKLAFLCGKQDFIFVDDYCPFFKCIDIDKDPSITFVQVWHAGLGFKAVGYGRFGSGGKAGQYPYESSHRKYDYVIVGGESLRPSYAESFGMDVENCLPYGLMRLDHYLDENKIEQFKENFYQDYPQFKNKKIILFAPTFRGNGQRTAYYPYEKIDLHKIYELCGEKYVFLIKMHPYIKELIQIDTEYQDRIFEFSHFKNLEELFYVTDILITDFSSNIYEFALFKKPIVFYAFDCEEYEFTRTVHSPLKKCAPGTICYTFDELIQTIKQENFEMHKLYEFLDKNYNKDNSLASDLVIDNIILKKN